MASSRLCSLTPVGRPPRCRRDRPDSQALAYTSKTPGKTQQFNYFVVNNNTENAFYLVDMPGMGYARVSRSPPSFTPPASVAPWPCRRSRVGLLGWREFGRWLGTPASSKTL